VRARRLYGFAETGLEIAQMQLATAVALESGAIARLNALTPPAPAPAAAAPAFVPFAPDATAQAFVTALMSGRDEPVAGSRTMSVLRLGDTRLFPQQATTVILRAVTLPFWTAVADTLHESRTRGADDRVNVVAVGSPGTGKSATTPVLIRLLLQRGKTVVFQVRDPENHYFYLFRRSHAGGFEGLACRSPFLSVIAELQEVRDVVLVIEPREIRMPPSVLNFACPFVLICSPNEAHFKGLIKGGDHGYGRFLYYPLWEADELRAARHHILVDGRVLREDQVAVRSAMFGGCARNVFAKQRDVRDLLRRQNSGVARLPDNHAKALLEGADADIVEGGEGNGVISSTVAGYASRAPFDAERTLAVVLSPVVRGKIWCYYLFQLWHDIARLETRAEAGYAFERYCYHVLCSDGAQLEVRRLGVPPGAHASTISMLARARSRVRAPEAQAAAHGVRGGVSPLFVPSVSNYPLIDAADRGPDGQLRAFQCTVATQHTADPAAAQAMLAAFGSPRRVALYFMVPSHCYNAFALPTYSAPYPAEVELYAMRVDAPTARAPQMPGDLVAQMQARTQKRRRRN